MNQFESNYKLGKDGVGYVKNYETGESFEVLPHQRNTAQNRDRVKVEVRGESQAEIVEIIKRAKYGYAGVLQNVDDGRSIIDPIDWRDPAVIVRDAKGVKSNHMVFVVPTEYIGTDVFGKIEKDLGPAETNDARMNSIALEKGFDADFPADVQTEVEEISRAGITDEDIKGRRDMRDVPTITIDPADAKDFDDALSFRLENDDIYEIGVHIADVSHYVRPGTRLDAEAYRRAASVYLVDRTIPMLPEELSNDLCSLNPNVDRLAYSVIFKIKKDTGEVLDRWFGRTVIHSDRRFSYQEAQEICDSGAGEWSGELSELVRLSKIYEKQKYERGALNMETDEVKFVLDEAGHPLRVIIKERFDMHRMIEEFMLLANISVAKFLEESDVPSIYRVHDKPDPEKMRALGEFLRTFNFHVEYDDDGIIPSAILQRIIDESANNTTDTIQISIIRSMQKAIYSPENIGHFGLAYQSYTHFTSPIRRYPDLIVHRIMSRVLQERIDGGYSEEWLTTSSAHCSDREKEAATAERESIRVKQIEFMAERIGKEFDAVVTGASKFGVFVSELGSRSEGMIPMRELGSDYYIFDEERREVRGQRGGERFAFGTELRVCVTAVDTRKQNISYSRVL